MATTPGAEPPSAPDGQDETGPARSVFTQGPYLRLLLGSLSGTFADRLYQVAVIAAVQLAFTSASAELSIITAAGVLAQFLLYPVIGSLVDRFDRRRMLWGISALKVLLVLAFVPFLTHVADPSFREGWKVLLLIIFVLSLVTVPFGPARAAAIPDVVTPAQTGIGASLMACTNLFSILIGSLAGTYLSVHLGPWLGYPEELRRGPMLVIPIAAALYVVSALLLHSLPAQVAVPGTQRKGAPQPPEGARPGLGARLSGYLRDTWEGLRYSWRTRGVLALYLFESSFWLCAVAFYVLYEWHTPLRLHLLGDDKVIQFGLTLGCAGVGLFVGALAIGKVCRFITPILTYPIAVLLIGLAMKAVFHSHGTPNPEHLAEINAQNIALARGLLPYDFLIGLGGGLLLGRVDADMLAIAEERMRGRVFALKGFCFTGALILPLAYFYLYPDYGTAWNAAFFLPYLFIYGFAPVAALAWMLDCGLHAERSATGAPGLMERGAYRLGQAGSWLISKLYFRYSIVGAAKIPRSGPVILAANHGSFLDPFWLGICTRRIVRYIMHASYYRSWLHPMFRHFCTISVEAGSTLGALKAGKQVLEYGGVIGMFPEGHVSDDGKLQPPKGGALFLAQRSGATVVPIAIKGNVKAFPRAARFPRPRRVTAIVGAPFTVPKDATREQIAELTDALMAQLAKLLEMEPPEKGPRLRE